MEKESRIQISEMKFLRRIISDPKRDQINKDEIRETLGLDNRLK